LTLRYIDPLKEIGGKLLEVEKPARYTGGEFGIITKKCADAFQTLIAFPDLYEIGMGNQALSIIYNRMNGLNGIVCDRAFAPAPDFEKLLREIKIPLYGLDTGISLSCLDLLMFTLGYELGLNGILTMLDVCGIPLHCEDRKNDDYPILIAGGPVVSNPLPYSPFIDAFWIGEAEAGFFELAAELAQLKKSGKGRAALFEKIASHENIWVKGKGSAKRAIAADFSSAEKACETGTCVFPIPSMKIIHNHGNVEIMRGCPNGCRFCHAGYWYRPARQKNPELIALQAHELVTKGGWQEISLSSLSSGDYYGIEELVETLNYLFKENHVSFQMPSLKVSNFSLDLLEKISVTRKSGLTFAVETPCAEWQMSINKEVSSDSTAAIIEEAKKRGWKSVKFYFMIGLPVQKKGNNEKKTISEEEEIVNFILNIARRTRMHFNVNVGIFVPKPHTPYQCASQLDSSTAAEKLNFIRSKLKSFGHKVSVSDTLISRIEGLMSRGDEKAGLMCEEAWKNGSRLDTWTEFINKEIWRQLLDKNKDTVNLFLSGENKPFPWERINSNVTLDYLRKELEKSNNAQLTPSCKEKCGLCGVCGDKNQQFIPRIMTDKKEIFFNSIKTSNLSLNKTVNHNILMVNEKKDPDIYRVLFSFCKHQCAVFHGHLSLIEIFSMSLRRAGLNVLYTQGFNPLAKIEFASPLTTGISADNEIASADFSFNIDSCILFSELNKSLPKGINIVKAETFYIPSGIKKRSLSSLLWGFAYSSEKSVDYVNFENEKLYRKSRLENDSRSIFSLKRSYVLAKNITGEKTNEYASYFDVYRYIYPS